MVIYKDFNQVENIIYIDKQEKDRGKRLQEIILSKIKKGYLTRDGKKTKVDDVVLVRLDVGDIIYNELIYEYKTIKDCRDSIINGNLFRQCQDMYKLFKYPYLIVVGDKSKFFKNPLFEYDYEYNKYENALNNIGNAMPVQQPLCEHMAFDTIIKTIVEHKTGHGMSRKYLNKTYNGALDMVHTSTPLSYNQSTDLIKTFGIAYPCQLFSLNESDFKKIKGVGDKKAKQIYTALYGGFIVNNKKE